MSRLLLNSHLPLIKNIFYVVSIFVLFGIQNAIAEEDEFAVKAAFLGKLLQFIEWPTGTQTKNELGKFNLCILDQHPLIPFLSKIDNTQIVALTGIDQHISMLKNCDILYLPKTGNDNLTSILNIIRLQQPLLTFADTPNYAQKGVMINFYVEKQRVGFEVNWKIAKRHGFYISARVLKLARIVDE